MIKWLHHLFNPHCEHCILEREDSKICNSCEILKHELEVLRLERDRLLDKLLDKPEVVERMVNEKEPVPFKPSFVHTHVRRQMLEQEDRARVNALKNAPKPVETLESELGIENAPTN
jgi:hypothetical protein